jgi:hypothetical protein
MPSTFAWVDFEEKDRQKMMEVIKMFQETDTRDELGIGTIRDTFSELFFPGTTTIQTRLKYMLFIPWIYLRLEKSKTPSNQFAQKVFSDEVALINALLKSDDTLGVIGGEAKESLRRMASSVYWPGLARWGIRQFNGSAEELHRYMDHYYAAKSNVIKDDDREPVGELVRDNWHSGLPSIPEGFPNEASFKLSCAEAQYLLERIMANCSSTLLAYLASEGQPTDARYIWEHPAYGDFPARLKMKVDHARNFAITINGAALLYNLMLAEKRQDEELISKYKERLEKWIENMSIFNYTNWSHEEFWDLVENAGRIPPLTKKFVSDWFSIVNGSVNLNNLIENNDARNLIILRERRLKRNRARLENQRALEMWTGAAGTGILSYRWEIARSMINDLLLGLQEGV